MRPRRLSVGCLHGPCTERQIEPQILEPYWSKVHVEAKKRCFYVTAGSKEAPYTTMAVHFQVSDDLRLC
jgi:hypothetical protein